MRIFIILIGLLVFPLNAQFVQVGDGSYLGTFAGPMRVSLNTKTYQSKYAYIFPKTVLGNLQNGDSITSLEFMRTDGDTLRQSRMRMWLVNTNRSDLGATGIRFSQETAAATLVHDDNPQKYFGRDEKFYRLPFNKPYVYDSLAGENLLLLVFFEQKDTFKAGVSFYFEGSATVNGYGSQQTHFSAGLTASDTLNNITEYHPTIIFNYPRKDVDLLVRGTYTLGKIPLPLGNPDSVKSFVRNVGKKDVFAMKMYTYTKGYNKQKDSFYITLPAGREKFFEVPSLLPSKVGLDTVVVESSDQVVSNNIAVSYRLGNENMYSYRDVTLTPAPGGIGFNGAQGDFVARFQSNKSKYINQISVAFGATGRLFRVGIWSYDSIKARPGKLIYQSDSLKSISGTYILDLKSPVKVEGSFFVGVRQLDLNNVAFGYQMEQPVRPQTFFYASPLGDTNWVDFHPNAPYKFIIEPRLQADYDYRAVLAKLPKDTFDILNKDTIAPVVTVKNVGALTSLDSVEITCEIRGLNVLHYKKTIKDTLSAGLTRQYTLPKEFVPKEFGEHRLLFYVKHLSDKINDNDTFRSLFYVGVLKDVQVKTVYSPTPNSLYIYKVDTLQPLIEIINLGYDNTPAFDAYCQIVKNNKVLYSAKINQSLPRFQTKLLVFPTYQCVDTGKLKVLLFTRMTGDRNTTNDTQIRYIIVYKKVDFVADSILSPVLNQSYAPGTSHTFKAQIVNDGVLQLGKPRVVMKVFGPNNNKIYEDSTSRDIDGNSQIITTMPRTLKTNAKGKYKVWLGSNISHDIYPENDSLVGEFFVGYPVDFYLDKVDLADTLSNTGSGYSFNFNVGNRGFENAQNKVDVRCEISRKGTVWHSEDISIIADTSSYKSYAFLKKFKPLFTGEYELKAFVKHPNDVTRSNDTFTKKVWVLVGKDALVSEILEVKDGEIKYQPTVLDTLKLMVLNQGVAGMNNVQVFAKIFKKNQSIYETFTTVNLSSTEQKMITFLPSLGSLDTSMYRVVTYTSSLDDQNIFNDSMSKVFYVRRMSDLRLIQLDSPSQNGQYKSNFSMRPRVLLMNTGQDSAIRNIQMNLQVWIQGNVTPVYESQLTLNELLPQQDATVFAMQDFMPSQQGSYNYEIYAVNNSDLWPNNDTIKGNFQVTVNAVNSLTKFPYQLYPNPTSNQTFSVKTEFPLSSMTISDVLGRSVDFSVNGERVFGGWNSQLNTSIVNQNNANSVNNAFNKEWKIKIHGKENSGVVYLKLISENGSTTIPVLLETN